jgi:predicted Zn-dependent protease
MRKIFWILLGMVSVAAACAQEPDGKTLTLVNAAAVESGLLEQVRAYTEKELRVPVRAIDRPELAGKESFQTLEKAALTLKSENDVVYIVVAELPGEEHLQLDPETGIAVINAKALYTADAEKFDGRIRRMVMRAAAFAFGLEPTPDPFCVTRDYQSLDDLDRMGNNYSPPWQMRYAGEAEKRGLRTIQPVFVKPPLRPAK